MKGVFAESLLRLLGLIRLGLSRIGSGLSSGSFRWSAISAAEMSGLYGLTHFSGTERSLGTFFVF